MRNTAIYLSFLVAILAGAWSCDSFLDVRPKGEVLSKDLLTDRKGFENALYGVYAGMRTDELYGGNLGYYTLDVMAQYFTPTGNSNTYFSEVLDYNYEHSLLQSAFLSIWSTMYRNIAYANNVLINLENYSPTDFRYYNVYKGEALGLRAFMHFDLLRLFTGQITRNPQADGIPYNKTFSLVNPDVLKAAKVYEYILDDLAEAERLLSETGLYEDLTGNEKFLYDRQIHFNLRAVQALRARVCLTMGDHENALAYAERVIKSEDFSLAQGPALNGDVAGCLSQTETIFGLYSKTYNDGVTTYLYQATSYTSLDPRRDIQQIYERNRVGNDNRWDYWYKLSAIQGASSRLIKLSDPYIINNTEYLRPEGQIRGLNLIRLPEMYYIAAECLLEKGRYGEALDYFNDVLESRGLIALDERTPAETLTLERITEERYKEFIGEGQTFFNMKRLNLSIDTTTGGTLPASNAVYVPDIPKEEFEYRQQ